MSNKLIIISGTSGSGKSTIIKSIMDNEVISFTTRLPRIGERNGVDYIFITTEKFNELLHNNGLMEHTKYGDNFYGVTRQEFETKLKNKDSYFISDYNGLKQMKHLYDNIISIYIYCEKSNCEKNMRTRGDSEDMIEKRLSTYESEIENMHHYNHVVTNNPDELDASIEDVREIIYGGS